MSLESGEERSPQPGHRPGSQQGLGPATTSQNTLSKGSLSVLPAACSALSAPSTRGEPSRLPVFTTDRSKRTSGCQGGFQAGGTSPPHSLMTWGPGHPTRGGPPGKSLRLACSLLTQPPGALTLPSFWGLCTEALSWDCANQRGGAAAPTEGGRDLLRTGDYPLPALLHTVRQEQPSASRLCCLHPT